MCELVKKEGEKYYKCPMCSNRGFYISHLKETTVVCSGCQFELIV